MGRQAVFVRVVRNPIKIGGHQVTQGDEVVGDYDVINGLPGMTFLEWAEEPPKIQKPKPNKPKNNNPKPSKPKVEKAIEIVDKTPETKVIKEEKQVGFSPETLKELKARTSREWMVKKKADIKKIMDEAGIDYSSVKDERMALYKFLIDILKEL